MYMVKLVSFTPKEEFTINYELGICLFSGHVVPTLSAAKEIVRDAKGICPLVHLQILRKVAE